MQSSFLTTVFLPLALFIIMLGMGLGLTLNDFKRVFIQPKAVILGLIAQLIVLPIIGFLLAMIFPLLPELAVGVMILAACPGGPTSNMVTYLVRGNVALSITLTAISSLITVFTIPLMVNLFFLGLIIAGLLLKERNNVASFFFQVGGVTLTLNLLTMALGYTIATLGKLDSSSAKAITVEVGIQNGTLAIAVATTLLNSPNMAIPAAIYSLIMFVTSAAFAGIVRNRQVKV